MPPISQMSRKQPRFHVFGWKASTDARPFYSTFSKRQYFTLAASIQFPARDSRTQTAACNRLHKIEKRLPRWLLIAQYRVDSGIVAITQVAQALLPVRFSRILATIRPSSSSLSRIPRIERSEDPALALARSRLVSTPRDRLQYKNPFEEGALLRLQKIQIHAPCKPLAA
jgi:hypothetical protein